MIRKRFRRRPEFESLESMVLLSGGFAPEHGLAALVVTGPKVKTPIALTGSAIGNYRFGHGLGTPINFGAIGLIKPLGGLTLKGSMLFEIQNPTGQVTISTSHGKVFATLSATSPGSVFSYTITGGTGKWANASGTGDAFVFTVPAGGVGSTHGRISINFVNLTDV